MRQTKHHAEWQKEPDLNCLKRDIRLAINSPIWKAIVITIIESTDNVEKIVSIEQLDVYGGWYWRIVNVT